MKVSEAVERQYPLFDQQRYISLTQKARSLRRELATVEAELRDQENQYLQVLGFTTGWQAKERDEL